MYLLQVSDFVGFFKLALSNIQEEDLQVYIDRYEAEYVRKIFGVVMGDAILQEILDANGQSLPISQAYSDETAAILFAFAKQDDNDCIFESKGLADVLRAFVFYHYITETQARHTPTGVIVNQAEVANIQSPYAAQRFAERKFNEALDSVDAIQWYCTTFAPADYPDYNGTTIKPKYDSLR